MPEAQAHTFLRRSLDNLDTLRGHLEDHGESLAQRLLESHRRVRQASVEIVRGLKVDVEPTADILGVFVFVPPRGRCPMSPDPAAFIGVRIQGGLLPAGVLTRISEGDIEGSTAADYHLAGGESARDAANRVWAYMRGVWRRFQDELADVSATDAATGITRERFLLPLLSQLDYGRVPPAPSGGLAADDDPDKRFPISHLWDEDIPIHLLGAGVDLDKRSPGVVGAAKVAPQSMVQEYLNRTSKHVWGILANGRVLRLLRDSTSLTGSAYVEFDLDAIFGGELFSDFLLLFRLCHQSRLASLDDEIGGSSWWNAGARWPCKQALGR